MCGRPGGRRSAPGASWHSMRRSSPRSPCAGRSASGWRPPRERTRGRKRRPRGARAVRGRRRGVLGTAGRVPAVALFVSTLNRNLRSFLLAIVGAEYLLKLIPRGTHEYERLIRPAELARWARSAGLELRSMAGLELNPFTARAALTRSVAVNYLAHFGR